MGKHSKFQHSKGINPAVQKAKLAANIEAKLIDAHNKGVNRGCLGFEIIALMILHDKFGMEEKDIKRFADEVNYTTDSVIQKYVSIPDMIKCLHEECGFTMTDDQLIAIDPSLAGFLSPENEENK